MGLNELFEQAMEYLCGTPMGPENALKEFTDRGDLYEDFIDFLEAHNVYVCGECGWFSYPGELNCDGDICSMCEDEMPYEDEDD